ncbi:VOC family protein [Coraliomargarita akajimensis]|uniref:Glyoxalase/bleomycin resistance protein/dioxygenase n=1 Tax=Coraliomargarita akajimensis (strain DSM 45221 / IAM 15411 / JCM 23193 / KCTC 12865 / 04OKA010-24) TaxID=583355 RepID=D5EPW4_CORAD|nr:VOC family protein [Coraliomargarita akajimensis]ADE55697.1 Glyoxalase/bleomycin resistance protein/dioxygenase [Coraliomargarita akajimensis DSM 45221]
MRIEHVAIWAKDLQALKHFYEQYFGAKSGSLYRNEKKRFSSYFLSFGNGVRLELMHMDGVPESKNDPIEQSTGFIHIAFSVGSEQAVDELTSTLKRDGYAVLDGPRKTGDGYYESAVLDPEDNRIEITI